jgi:hypothetical protein
VSGGLLAISAVALLAQAPPWLARTIRLPGPVSGLATIDLDGDKRHELLVASDAAVEIRSLDAGAPPRLRAERGAARSLAWCITSRRGEKDELWLVDDEGNVSKAEPGAPAKKLLTAGRLVLPSGIFSFPFARDLNGDGLTDLALPVPTGLRLWFGQKDGTFAVGASVRHRLEVDLGFPAPGQAHPDADVQVTIPSFSVADQNGDGHPDLAFQSADRLQFYWSDAQGHLPETPTIEIDLDEIKKKLGDDDESVIDPSNLFKALKNQVSATVRDLDGDGCADLLLRQGPKIGIYAGHKDGKSGSGIDRSKATQVLKTSGNLIATFVTDDNGDGKLDLCMVQAADVSLGELLLWVVAGGKLELDLYTYDQDGPLHFARSPSRKRRLIIEIPNLLTILNEIENNPQLKELGDELSRQPVALDLEAAGRQRDLALITRDGRVDLFAGVIPESVRPSGGPITSLNSDDVPTWRDVIDRFEREAKDGEVTIPLLKILDWVPMPGGKLRAMTAGRTPTATLGDVDPETLVKGKDGRSTPTRRFLVVDDLDGDGRDDLVLVEPAEENGEGGDGSVTLTVFMTPGK